MTGLRPRAVGASRSRRWSPALPPPRSRSRRDHVEQPGAVIAVGLFVALVVRRRRPVRVVAAADEPLRRADDAVGFLFLLVSLDSSDDSWRLHPRRPASATLYYVAFVHVLLVYPDGRFERTWHRRLIAGGYVLGLLGPLPMLLWRFPDRWSCDGCPPSALLIAAGRDAADDLRRAHSVLGVAVIARGS